jgi:hypothetical protein
MNLFDVLSESRVEICCWLGLEERGWERGKKERRKEPKLGSARSMDRTMDIQLASSIPALLRVEKTFHPTLLQVIIRCRLRRERCSCPE